MKTSDIKTKKNPTKSEFKMPSSKVQLCYTTETIFCVYNMQEAFCIY